MNKLFCIISTGRSGTSLLSNLASTINFKLSDNLLGSHDTNPKGHFEDMHILATNEAFFKRIGRDFFTLGDFSEQDKFIFESKYSKAISFYLNDTILKKQKLVLKEPRISKMFEMYKKIFENLNCKVYYLFLYRNPLSFAKSAIKSYHNKPPHNYIVTEEIASKIWFSHTKNLITNLTEQDNVYYLNFNDFVFRMPENIQLLANFVGEKIHQKNFIEYVSSFYDTKLVSCVSDEKIGYDYADGLYDLLKNRQNYNFNDFLNEVKKWNY